MRSAIALIAAAATVGIAAPVPARAHATGHSERLAARARRGDRVARTVLVEEHMGLVRAIAFRYRSLGLPVEDLAQEGAIGLLKAIDYYDPAKGTSFSTYAFWRIRAAVTHAVTARGNLVRVPRPVLEHRRRVAAARRSLSAEEREPALHDLAAATALDLEDVAEALLPSMVVSLDELLPDGSLLTEHLTAPGEPPDTIGGVERTALREALGRLRPREQTILTRHFGIDREPETLTAIAADLQLSRERTRALKEAALRELASDLADVA